VGDGIKLILLKNTEQPRMNRAGTSASRPGRRRARGRRSRKTAELLHAGATNQPGFTNHQLKILGVERREAWLRNLIGVEIPTMIYPAFLEANPARHSTNRRGRKPRKCNLMRRADRRTAVWATPFRDIPPYDESLPWE
jgi:hypothetical protein